MGFGKNNSLKLQKQSNQYAKKGDRFQGRLFHTQLMKYYRSLILMVTGMI